MEKQAEKIKDLSNISIESERLVLRPISHNYDRDIFNEFDDKATEFLPRGPYENLEVVDSFITESIEQAKNGTNLSLAITTKDGEFLGLGGLKEPCSRVPEFSLWLKKPAQGQGFGYELIFAITEWANDELDFDYLEYCADSEATQSCRIAEKLIETYGGKYIGEVPENVRGIDRMTKVYQILPRVQK